jgi:hypothetical protein
MSKELKLLLIMKKSLDTTPSIVKEYFKGQNSNIALITLFVKLKMLNKRNLLRITQDTELILLQYA